MPSKRDEVLAKIRNMTPNELKARSPEETPKMKRKRIFSTIKKIAEALNIRSINIY